MNIFSYEYDKIKYSTSLERAYYELFTKTVPVEYIGKWIMYDHTNRPFSEGHYENGKRHGRYIELHRNGNLHIECEYNQGKLHGKFIMWNDKKVKY